MSKTERPVRRRERGTDRPDIKYLACDCPFVKREVWAILTQQTDGTWKVVNCLDKENACDQYGCAFTTHGGRWPFDVILVPKDRVNRCSTKRRDGVLR